MLLILIFPLGLYFEISILVNSSFKVKKDMDERSVFNCLVNMFHVVTDLCVIELRPYLVVFLLGWNRHPNLELREPRNVRSASCPSPPGPVSPCHQQHQI